MIKDCVLSFNLNLYKSFIFFEGEKKRKISLDMRVITSLDKMAKLKNYSRPCRFSTLSTRDIYVDTIDFYSSRIASRIIFSIYLLFPNSKLFKSYRSRYSIRNTTKKILSSFFFNFSVAIKDLNVTVNLKLGVQNNKLNISNLTFYAHLKKFNVSIRVVP